MPYPAKKKFSERVRWVWELFYKADPENGPDEITREEYIERLISQETKSETLKSLPPQGSAEWNRAERAFKMVVETRKFEIELYWKRAAYFWAFIVSVFVAYAALRNSNNPSELAVFSIIVLGFVIAVAWHLANIGSKQWQRHWEKHLDLMEPFFVGPLYKTIYFTKTFSVSKLNTIVSFAVIVLWVLLGYDHLRAYDKDHFFTFDITLLSVDEFLVSALGLLAVFSMIFGYGRGRFGSQNAQMHERKLYYRSREN